jgi:methyl coenzyme M reductase alpha subunit
MNEKNKKKKEGIHLKGKFKKNPPQKSKKWSYFNGHSQPEREREILYKVSPAGII